MDLVDGFRAHRSQFLATQLAWVECQVRLPLLGVESVKVVYECIVISFVSRYLVVGTRVQFVCLGFVIADMESMLQLPPNLNRNDLLPMWSVRTSYTRFFVSRFWCMSVREPNSDTNKLFVA